MTKSVQDEINELVKKELIERRKRERKNDKNSNS
jgi:hypothetical protein